MHLHIWEKVSRFCLAALSVCLWRVGELRSGFLWKNRHGARAQGNLLFPCKPELPHILLSKLSTSWRKQYNLISCTLSSIKNQLLQSKCSSARIGEDAPFGGAVCSVHKDPNTPQVQDHKVQGFGGGLAKPASNFLNIFIY